MNDKDYVLTQSDIRLMFNYDPLTGLVTYAEDTPRKKKGDSVGYMNNGYLKTSIRGKHYNLGVIAWMYVNGEMLHPLIDHIDHNRTNNKIDNLRCVTYKENNRNRTLHKNNKSGCHGVSWFNHLEQWCVYFKGVEVDYFDTYPEAVTHRKKLEKDNNYHSNHGKSKVTEYNHYDDIMSMYRKVGLKV